MLKLFEKNMNEKIYNIAEYQLNIWPLDNFSAFGLEMDGEYFQTAEHAFQYLKFVNTNFELAKKIKKAYSPNEARNIAQENKIYKLKNWNDVKYAYMEKILKLKVDQNPEVMEKLLNTKKYSILENCIDEDTDWGVDNNNKGENNLGKILMRIRDEILLK